jgi:hypothetical protein
VSKFFLRLSSFALLPLPKRLTDNVKQRLFDHPVYSVRTVKVCATNVRNDEELALKAVQISTELLNQIKFARAHIEKAYRVQIEQNVEGYPCLYTANVNPQSTRFRR